ncbi:MAG: glycosyltransferase [Patescibacteria group bacterium]|nr:glycosyltransferase [Patescibacteria group bacterium]
MINENQVSFTNYYVVLTAYNEEQTVLESFLSIKKAIEYSLKQHSELVNVSVVFCHNGCTDKTPDIISDIQKRYSDNKITINVLLSPKGKAIAQNTCMRHIRSDYVAGSPIVFIDTDVLIDEKVIDIFLSQLKLHPNLKVVGSHPIPIPYEGNSFIRSFWHHVLNCRAYFPKSEVTVHFAPEFHPYADTDPQPIGAKYEKRSRF